MFIHGKKIFLDTENSITIYKKLIQEFNDVSILESVIGGENKGRYSIILFNIYENIEIHQNFIISNSKKRKISSPDLYLKSLQKNNNFTDLYNQKIPVPFTIGNISFDLAKFSLPKLKYDMSKNEINIPLAHFIKPKNLIIIDNILNETHLIEFSINKNINKTNLNKIENILLLTPKKNRENSYNKPSKFKKHMSKNSFFEKVNNLKKEIINGEIFQAVL